MILRIENYVGCKKILKIVVIAFLNTVSNRARMLANLYFPEGRLICLGIYFEACVGTYSLCARGRYKGKIWYASPVITRKNP